MSFEENNLKNALTILDDLKAGEEQDTAIFTRKLEILKKVALTLLEEIEALEFVRTVNIRKGINLHEEMRLFEIHLVQSALERTGGNRTHAAKLLELSHRALLYKIKEFGLS